MKLLITGMNGYIGRHVETWLKKYEPGYQVTFLSVRSEEWKQESFKAYDVILHLAGIAHNPNYQKKRNQDSETYYRVNRDLTIALAKKAKADGIKQFIFMSSIIVYGNSSLVGEEKIITKEIKPCPANYYGESKLQAEEGILKLADSNFLVSIIRSPAVYGEQAKGNMTKLITASKYFLFFPSISNKRSMIYIDTLCSFIQCLLKYPQSGIYFPQNPEVISTYQLVKTVREEEKKRTFGIPGMGPLFKVISKHSNFAKKIFGSLSYDTSLSQPAGFQYWNLSLKDTIKKINGKQEE